MIVRVAASVSVGGRRQRISAREVIGGAFIEEPTGELRPLGNRSARRREETSVESGSVFDIAISGLCRAHTRTQWSIETGWYWAKSTVGTVATSSRLDKRERGRRGGVPIQKGACGPSSRSESSVVSPGNDGDIPPPPWPASLMPVSAWTTSISGISLTMRLLMA